MAGFLDFLSGAAQGVDENVQANLKLRREQQQKLQQLQMEQQFKAQYDPEYRFKSQVLSQLPKGPLNLNDPATRGILQIFGATLPKTLQQIKEEEQAKTEGVLAGDPQKGPKEQTDRMAKLADLMKKRQDLSPERFDWITGKQRGTPQQLQALDQEIQSLLHEGVPSPSSPSTPHPSPSTDGTDHPLVGQTIHGEKIKSVRLIKG